MQWINAAVAGFLGAFAALVVLAEVQAGSKWVRYLVAFVVGLLVVVLLAMLLAAVLGLFGKIG